MTSLKRGLHKTLLVSVMCMCLSPVAQAQVVDSTLWGFSPGDRVLAIAPAGDTIYLGGSFLFVGPSTGGGVPVDAHTAVALPSYPRVVGRVEAVLADGEGGWFIAGRFTHVDSQPRQNLAHIDADGSVSPWAPNPNGQVWTIFLSASTLFVGGDFDSIGGQPRMRLAALSTESNEPLPFRCDADGRISALLVNGGTLYVGGWFTSIGGQSRSYVAAADAVTGSLSSWQVALDDRVRALAIRDTTLYIGGYFWTANAESRMCLIAVGASSGMLHPWNPGIERTPVTTRDGGPHVNAVLVCGDSLFVAGSFSRIGGQNRRGLAQVDADTAVATAWDPRARRATTFGPDMWTLLRSGDTLFVAGAYDSLGGRSVATGSYAAALDARSAERFDWDPHSNDFIFALALQHGVVFVGGWFTSVGEWVYRPGLASIDARTGRVTDWDPRPSNYVQSLLVHGGKVYVGGNFSSIGGQPRNFIAALDPVTGEPTAWNPGADWSVRALAPLGNTVLAGGQFSSIGGQARRGIAAIDTSTGFATTWDAGLAGEVYAMAVGNSAIYVGGDFASVGGQPRASLAAVDPVTAAVSPWNPGSDGTIEAMTLLDATLYVGGWFHQVGGLPRNYLAAIKQDGAVIEWAPNVFGPVSPSTVVKALVASDSTVFVGGYFSGLSGESRAYFAALDATSAAIRTSYPTVDGPVWSLAVQDGILYVGGGFGRVGSLPQICFAAIKPAPNPELPEVRELAFVQAAPNPARDHTTIRYTLPANQVVNLTLFDLQGRAVARPLANTLQAAGPQQVSISIAGLSPGCYLYRLEAGGMSATRKIVVLR